MNDPVVRTGQGDYAKDWPAVKCPACDGKGSWHAGPEGTETCDQCGGTGKVNKSQLPDPAEKLRQLLATMSESQIRQARKIELLETIREAAALAWFPRCGHQARLDLARALDRYDDFCRECKESDRG